MQLIAQGVAPKRRRARTEVTVVTEYFGEARLKTSKTGIKRLIDG
jgi:hypothetical protein